MRQGVPGPIELFTSSSVTEEGYTVDHREDIPTCGAHSVAIADSNDNKEKDFVFSSRYNPEGKVPIE